MPLLLTTHPFPAASFGLWLIAEEESFFRLDLPLSDSEEAELASHHNDLRRLEWLAGRWLLHKLTDAPERLPLAKDAFSKPFFPENLDMACSLSHSRGHVGALIFTEQESPRAVGCDIQVMTEKMRRIAPKFLRPEEAAFIASFDEAQQFELLHLYWTAKESLYKAWGLKELDFRKHLSVTDLNWDGQSGRAEGKVEKNEYLQLFSLVFGKMMLPDDQTLIWAACEAK
jgi:phosphopantetheinyl transferase